MGFNNNHQNCRTFLNRFEPGLYDLDPNFLAQALATITHRPCICISTLTKHENNSIFKFITDCKNPPLIFGIYQHENKQMFKNPFFKIWNMGFSFDNLKRKVQIFTWLAKSVSNKFDDRTILDLCRSFQYYKKLIQS